MTSTSTSTSPRLSSRADVATGSPERYAKQLVAHLGRKVEFTAVTTPSGTGQQAAFGDGVGSVVVGDGVLVLLAEAPDQAGLDRVQHVLGSHLERFGQRSELVVTWVSQPA